MTPADTGPSPSPSAFTVCVVPTVQGVRDGSVNQLTLQGIKAAAARVLIEQPASPTDYVTDLQACVATTPAAIVAVSAAEADAVAQVAGKSPASRFLLVDAQPVGASGQPLGLSNLISLVFDEKDAGYLAGALAGLMENQKVGAATRNGTAILGLDHSAPVDHYIAGYVAGARAVDPQIAIKLAYSDSADPDFCRQLGRDQVTAGADILFEVQDRCAAGYIDAAYRAGVYAIGSETDRAALSPAVITSAVKRIDQVVAQLVAEVQRGSFHAGVRSFGLANDGTGYSTPSSVVPQDIINRVEDLRARIISGAVTPPDTVPPL
ncbi:MAG TPA: BMP family ABC transporter substrate-binding protein [Candidatus Limnocylindrales bacterium]|nr:BMP family ABC transporter substrate-binding protein [Candidatus Limnocylindrales bacterium]